MMYGGYIPLPIPQLIRNRYPPLVELFPREMEILVLPLLGGNTGPREGTILHKNGTVRLPLLRIKLKDVEIGLHSFHT